MNTGWSSGFKNTAYYEAERKYETLSHSEFAKDAEFEYLDNSDDMVGYLLSKDYDKYFSIKRNGQTTVDTSIANTIFHECYSKFKHSSDAVVVFHIITDFYAIDSKHLFEKLVKKFRMLLIRDLKERMNIPDHKVSKLSSEYIQQSFITHLKNDSI